MIGARRSMRHAQQELDHESLIRLWTKTTQGVVDYGLGINYAKLERPKLGIFDGLKLVIDPAVGFEMQCFLVLHLFGHSVQWIAPSYRPEIVAAPEPQDDLESYLQVLETYERNAARFGLQLLHESGMTELDQWFFDFAASDWKYVEAFYRTGRIPMWESCRVKDASAIEPLHIPPLKPRPVEVRFAF
jgi:hypothetical protein